MSRPFPTVSARKLLRRAGWPLRPTPRRCYARALVSDEVRDEELVARMGNGDMAALAELYRRHVGSLLGLATAMLSDPSEAEDLLQDVFLESWRKANAYGVERGSVRAWLVTRTRSRALDRIRSAGRRRNVPSSEAPELVSPAVPVPERGQLHRVLMQIPDNQREVLLLAYFGDLSSQEMSDHLGIPVGTVKSRTRAALQALRTLLAGDDDG